MRTWLAPSKNSLNLNYCGGVVLYYSLVFQTKILRHDCDTLRGEFNFQRIYANMQTKEQIYQNSLQQFLYIATF